MSKLALLGGTPTLESNTLTPFNTIGREESVAAQKVLDGGTLSGFLASDSSGFLGGPEVRRFEEHWCDVFATSHAISVNSATSGLFAAVGAAGISPGDEVIVSPYTMSASVVAPLIYGGIPIFVDIEPDYFCLNPSEVAKAITEKTKAIIAVNIFGHPASLRTLRTLADENNLILIEDNAQAPLAKEYDSYAGTIGHIGVFSLNVHKHIQSGEGGVCTTNDPNLALRLQLIRNHGENLVDKLEIDNLTNLIGFNFRMTELTAAICNSQLTKLQDIVAERIHYAERLSLALTGLDGIQPPKVRDGCNHVYYVWPARFNAEKVGISRNAFATALAAEGVPVNQGYVKPQHLLPIFQRRLALGANGFPFNLTTERYDPASCPACRQLHYEEELGFGICNFALSENTIDKIISAFHKVYDHRHELCDS